MAFLSPDPPSILKDPTWPIRTYKPQYPPAFVDGGTVKHSILGSGAELTAATVVNSILSPGVRVREKAEVQDSILLEGVEIGRGARLRKVIIDKSSVIPERFEIGFDAEADARNFKISKGGVRVVPKGWKAE